MEELFSHRLFRIGIGFVALVLGAWAVSKLVRRFAEQEATRGARDVARVLKKSGATAAARVALEHGLFVRAAELYEGAGRLADAGRALRKAEKWERAAQVFESAEDYDSSAFCYRKAGDNRSLLRALDKAGNWLEAAQVAEEDGHLSEAADFLLRAGKKAEAVELLSRSGDKERALTISAEAREEVGDYDAAGRAWIKLEAWDRAIAAFVAGQQYEHAAKVMVKVGRGKEAAQMMVKAGKPAEAAALFEQAQAFRDAARNWQIAGEPERAIGALLREGDKLAVIKLRAARGEIDEALRVVSTVAQTEASYAEAIQIAAGLHRQSGNDRAAFQALFQLLGTSLAGERRLALTREAVELAVTLGQGRIGKALLERAADLIDADLSALAWVNPLRVQLGELDDTPEEMALVASKSRSLGRAQVASAVDNEATQGYAEGSVAYAGGELRAVVPAPFGLENDADGWPKGVPQSLGRRYSGLERIGQGGYGVVFRCHDKLLGRTVVLKFMIDGTMPSEMARKYFEREVKMAASLSHPNIVHIYDMGTDNDVPWYSMEYVEGQPLSAHMPAGKILTDNIFIMSVVEQISAALDHAHSREMVHRDIKPDNILISTEGTVKLLDFGLARVLDDSFGELSVLAGTPYYMAPEQIDGSPVDHRADIYAFGVILYRMFTGRLPFQDGNIFVAHAVEPVPDPLKFNPDLQPEVVELLNRCLAKRASLRPPNCGSINIALRDALFGHVRGGAATP